MKLENEECYYCTAECPFKGLAEDDITDVRNWFLEENGEPQGCRFGMKEENINEF